MASSGGHWVKGSFTPASDPGIVEKVLTDPATLQEIAAAANEVLDGWQPDEEGWDEEFGGGGACDSVCSAYNDVLIDKLGDRVEVLEAGHPGDEHAWSIVYDGETGRAWEVDIPPSVYEIGGGYNWTKIPDAHVTPRDVVVDEIPGFNIEDYY